MTPAELRAALSGLLSGVLGTYTLPSGSTVDAIYVGEPPSDWTASGLEVLIDPLGDFSHIPAHQTSAYADELNVRMVAHGSVSDLRTAERKVRSRWGVTRRRIPADEALGIPAQSTITIPA